MKKVDVKATFNAFLFFFILGTLAFCGYWYFFEMKKAFYYACATIALLLFVAGSSE